MNNTVTIENARILFRNFSGEAGRYNPKGNRNFCVLLDPDVAESLKEDGWNVKTLTPKEDGDPELPYIQVALNYGAHVPPRIVMITSRGKTVMTEDTVSILDWADIQSVDLILNEYRWEVNDRKGIKGYVKSMFVTIFEDELEVKYRDVPDSAQASMVSYDD